jgi:hypothetical protein
MLDPPLRGWLGRDCIADQSLAHMETRGRGFPVGEGPWCPDDAGSRPIAPASAASYLIPMSGTSPALPNTTLQLDAPLDGRTYHVPVDGR